MNVWVTGAGGFVGRHVVRALSTLPEVLVHGLHRSDAFGMADPVALMQATGTVPDLVVDLAWAHLDDYGHPSHVGSQRPLHAQFYQALIAAGVGDIVGVGTAAEYGHAERALSEQRIASPVSPYAIAKHQLCTELETMAVAAGVRWRWIRLFHLWGEEQPERTLYGHVRRLREDPAFRFTLSSPDRQLDYLHVGVAAQRIAAISMQRTVHGLINCGSGVPTSLRAMLAHWLADRPDVLARVDWAAHPIDEASVGYWADTARMNDALAAFHEEQ
jgi:dTDP-6-deoxy-L-talose 4-dehydrogenase (NAD+)